MDSTATIMSFSQQPSADNVPSLEAAKQYIYSIDFSMIIDKLIKRQKWLRIEAEECCKQYRNYLWLLKNYGTEKPLPPSEDIDEFWHHHILDTEKYIEDCDAVFGGYLHHYPYYGHDGKTTLTDLNRTFLETQKIYKDEFGASLKSVRYLFRRVVRIFLT